MSDLAETFRLMKEHTKQKKLSNLEYSTQLLMASFRFAVRVILEALKTYYAEWGLNNGKTIR